MIEKKRSELNFYALLAQAVTFFVNNVVYYFDKLQCFLASSVKKKITSVIFFRA